MESRVFDRVGCLLGEFAYELDVFDGEGARGPVIEGDGAEGTAAGDQRRREDGADALSQAPDAWTRLAGFEVRIRLRTEAGDARKAARVFEASVAGAGEGVGQRVAEVFAHEGASLLDGQAGCR